jgi:hypothetical protein
MHVIRFYAGQKLLVEFSPVTDFREARYEQRTHSDPRMLQTEFAAWLTKVEARVRAGHVTP